MAKHMEPEANLIARLLFPSVRRLSREHSALRERHATLDEQLQGTTQERDDAAKQLASAKKNAAAAADDATYWQEIACKTGQLREADIANAQKTVAHLLHDALSHESYPAMIIDLNRPEQAFSTSRYASMNPATRLWYIRGNEALDAIIDPADHEKLTTFLHFAGPGESHEGLRLFHNVVDKKGSYSRSDKPVKREVSVQAIPITGQDLFGRLGRIIIYDEKVAAWLDARNEARRQQAQKMQDHLISLQSPSEIIITPEAAKKPFLQEALARYIHEHPQASYTLLVPDTHKAHNLANVIQYFVHKIQETQQMHDIPGHSITVYGDLADEALLHLPAAVAYKGELPRTPTFMDKLRAFQGYVADMAYTLTHPPQVKPAYSK
jgi:hypothetical protein